MELNFYKQTGRDAMGPIVEDLTPPVDLDRDHWRGGERAAVTLVEYGDYECPYSRMAFRTIQRLEQQLAGQLRFVFRQLPLTGIHPHALAAAHFAEAAALQGRFWPMHELLFHRQQALEDSDLLGYADQLRLDRHQLLADLDGQTVRQRVQADADSALASGARGTPTLFINGRLHVAGYDEATLGAALAAAIKEA
jgi:protein-disulfide isomerase